jgi:predicted transcriptional regulator
MAERTKPEWTFLTNHAQVLTCIAEEPDIRGRDIAERVGITERAAQSIISDLVEYGYVTRVREGRRNHYTVNPDGQLRHPLQAGHTIGELLTALGLFKPTRRRRSAK